MRIRERRMKISARQNDERVSAVLSGGGIKLISRVWLMEEADALTLLIRQEHHKAHAISMNAQHSSRPRGVRVSALVRAVAAEADERSVSGTTMRAAA